MLLLMRTDLDTAGVDAFNSGGGIKSVAERLKPGSSLGVYLTEPGLSLTVELKAEGRPDASGRLAISFIL